MKEKLVKKLTKYFSIKYLFIGAWVTWNEKIYPQSMIRDMINKFGTGPFRVIGLKLRFEDPENISSLIVTVKVKGGVEEGFAGEWFKKTKKPD